MDLQVLEVLDADADGCFVLQLPAAKDVQLRTDSLSAALQWVKVRGTRTALQHTDAAVGQAPALAAGTAERG
jgi:hypothetical protein